MYNENGLLFGLVARRRLEGQTRNGKLVARLGIVAATIVADSIHLVTDMDCLLAVPAVGEGLSLMVLFYCTLCTTWRQ